MKWHSTPVRYLLHGLLFSICLPVAAQSLLNPKTQPRFVNPLPIPSVIDGRNGGLFTIGVSQFDQWLGLIDPATNEKLYTTVWGYNGSYPGPTILAKKDVPVQVFWRNNLVNGFNQPLQHLLPVDATLHWAFSGTAGWQSLGVPIVTHVHGGHSESASDGLPDAWFTPGFTQKGSGFIKGDIEPYYYKNDQQAATLWYHDHALGITRLNVYAGLAGYYLLTDANEMNLQLTGQLPAAPYDLGLAIQDRMFTAAGQLFYPSVNEEDPAAPSPSVLPEFFGNFILVNGMAWPALEVEPRQYRFRVLNGSDSRFYNLVLSSGQVFTQIGTDNGFLHAPVSLQQMLIGPGERKDIILDFSNPALAGQTIIMRNNAKTPFPKGAATDPKTTGEIMAFKVVKPFNAAYPLTPLPAMLRAPIIPLQTTLAPRKLVLFEAEDEFDRLKPMLGTVENGVMEWTDPITENPMLNDTEIWEIYNATMDAHPIHLHLVSMQLINRQKFNANIDDENGKPTNIRLVGQPQPPDPAEQGWKDTWVMYPGEVTRVIAKFDREGLYAWHCHILSHEDNEMMRPYYVGQMPANATQNKPAAVQESMIEKEWQLKVMPNPFSSSVTIRLQLPADKKLMIRLFDDKGSMIKTIFEGMQGRGLHQFTIDGTGLPAGAYICQVTMNEQSVFKKLILQK